MAVYEIYRRKVKRKATKKKKVILERLRSKLQINLIKNEKWMEMGMKMEGNLEKHCCHATPHLPLGGFTDVKTDMMMMMMMMKIFSR